MIPWTSQDQDAADLRAEVAALRQRAEATERALAEANAVLATLGHARDAERNLKRTAYAVLDDVRQVVEETIIPALERCSPLLGQLRLPGPAMSDPWRPPEDAINAVTAALAAARKTLTDTPKAQEE